MSDSAMLSAATVLQATAQREMLRTAVITGPAGVGTLDEQVTGRLWPLLADAALIERAQAVVGHVDARRRVLTGAVTVMIVLGLCLFRRESTSVVTARVTSRIPRTRVEGTPTAAAVSKARGRLPAAVTERVFTTGARSTPTFGPESYAFGLLVTAIDGTVFDLADTARTRAEFTTPTGGRFPQARMVALVACGIRWILAARIASSGVSEQALADDLIGELQPGTINLADRGFFSMDRWTRAAATGAHLLWRVKNGARSLPARLVEVLPDGSALVELAESDAMLSRRRTTRSDRTLPRLRPMLARLVEFTVTTRDRAGRTTHSRYRILTTLLDHHRHPATALAALYAERWQIELTYGRLKTTLRGPGTRPRGQTPQLAYQELWALLTVYNALVRLAVTTAVDLNIDPDAVSFATVLALTRAHLASQNPEPCVNCGHHDPDPTTTLLTAIAAQPRNRPTRTRTGPRTKRQRRTQRTRDVTYEITITHIDLPKASKKAKV
ncbi:MULTISPECIES: IS4 family transposase [unclassified Micromonospora]|uniref:IS4 family transposase n=2 Tax=Micromonospora TaxID=1873 RepID=UPI003A866960